MHLVSDFLDVGESQREADCIFVLAGKQGRKVYGIDLWRRGYAPELILSVGRFECRRFYHLSLPSDGGLKSLVERTPPEMRHFFVRFKDNQAVCSPVRRGRFGTMTEGRALARQLSGSGMHSLMVVSSPIHLRRVALVFRRTFHGSGIRLIFVAAPEELSLRTSAQSRAKVWTEFGKYLVYLVFWPIVSL